MGKPDEILDVVDNVPDETSRQALDRLQALRDSLQVADVTDAAEARDLDAAAREEWAYSAGLQVWLFGLPLMQLEHLRRLALLLDGPVEGLPFAPANQLGHMDRLPTAQSPMPFTPNVDTLYSGAMLQLENHPLVFQAAELPNRYWSLQVADAYLSNLPYLGTRSTGGGAGAWLFAGPNWDGDVPEGLTLYRSPSNTVLTALRVRAAGPGDVQEAARAQTRFTFTTVESYLAGRTEPAPAARPAAAPMETHELWYFTTLCRLLALDPPYGRDAAIVAAMRALGLPPGQPVNPTDLDPAVRRGLVRAHSQGPDLIAWKAKHRGRKSPTQWNVDLTGGSYGADYLSRAEGAIQGLFVHDPQECTYFHTYHDGTGAPLDGARTYTLRFGPEQVARTSPMGFWSVTAYNPGYQLVETEHDRYSVQSCDVVFDEDGGVTLTVGPEAPKGEPVNWISTRPGELFRLNYRVYLPDASMLGPHTVDELLPPVTPV